MTTSKFIIYGLVDPVTHQLRYIGKSERGLRRPPEHWKPHFLKAKTHKVFWLRQLLAEGLEPKVVVIQEWPSKERLADAEVFWIAYFKAMGCPLTNYCRGGEGFTGKHTEEAKKKIGAYWKGRKRGAWKEEHRQNWHRAKGTSPFKDQNGVVYQTITEAAQKLGLTKGNVHRVLHPGKYHYNQTGGYTFRYVE